MYIALSAYINIELIYKKTTLSSLPQSTRTRINVVKVLQKELMKKELKKLDRQQQKMIAKIKANNA